MNFIKEIADGELDLSLLSGTTLVEWVESLAKYNSDLQNEIIDLKKMNATVRDLYFQAREELKVAIDERDFYKSKLYKKDAA